MRRERRRGDGRSPCAGGRQRGRVVVVCRALIVISTLRSGFTAWRPSTPSWGSRNRRRSSLHAALEEPVARGVIRRIVGCRHPGHPRASADPRAVQIGPRPPDRVGQPLQPVAAIGEGPVGDVGLPKGALARRGRVRVRLPGGGGGDRSRRRRPSWRAERPGHELIWSPAEWDTSIPTGRTIRSDGRSRASLIPSWSRAPTSSAGRPISTRRSSWRS